MEKVTYELILSYNGSFFKGWHTQKDVPTVQGLLNEVLSELYSEKIFVWGAGRTDSGAHALKYHAHFRTRHNHIPQDKLIFILNKKLPGSVRIQECHKRINQFHATFSCQARSYMYCIYLGDVMPAALYQKAFHVFKPCNVPQFQEILSIFVGTHNFREFCYGYTQTELQKKHTERIVYSFRAKQIGSVLYCFIKGNGFLRGMIRSLIGVSLSFAMGSLSKNDLEQALSGQKLPRITWKPVPAEGLYFKRAHYEI